MCSYRPFLAISLATLLATDHTQAFVPCACGCRDKRAKQRLPVSPQDDSNEIRSLPNDDESWFVKTEQFCKPFPEVKPHLEAHREWVAKLRNDGYCITSGYRVDSEGKPGGGGLMFFAARDYDEAEALVRNDPLVANECVEWTLNGWIAEVGDIQLR